MSGPLAPYRGEPGVQVAEATVAELAARGIATHPANYEIWATHRVGSHPALSREIERLLAAGAPFTDAVNEKLFERYFANTRLSVQLIETGETIARELGDVSGRLREVGADVQTYAATLEAAADRCERGVSQADFAALARETGAQTREVAKRNAELAAAMAASARQVDALRAELEAVKVAALTDSLTGIANRKLFDETLQRRIDEAQADSSALCLLICDIDHFKRFNDQWGHAVGDQIIRFVAEQLSAHARPDWLAARHGGEEFAVIMPRTTIEHAHEAACAMANSIRGKILRRRSTDDTLGRVTVSMGIVSLRSGEDARDLFARADEHLYASKRNGRDRITLDELNPSQAVA